MGAWLAASRFSLTPPKGRDILLEPIGVARMRSALGLGASALAGLAAVIASLDGDADIVPFFVLLTFAGGVAAWAAQTPFIGVRRRIARGIALAWLVGAVWIAVLLVAYVAAEPGPPPTPDEMYLGLSATIYHLVGLYGGLVLVLLLAFGRRPAGAPRLVGTA
jgi:hypothetical protein